MPNTLYDPWKQGSRLKVIVGHYGSGKTEIALNMAIRSGNAGCKTVLCDLDVVNPFFRSAEQGEVLEENSVRCIFPPYALTAVDVPVLPPEVASVFGQEDLHTVLDVGGDDAGAAALGQYYPYFVRESSYDVYYVVNPYRPFSATAEQIMDMINRISFRSRLRVTGIINNANLGVETKVSTITDTRDFVNGVAKEAGLPVVALAAEESVAKELPQIAEPVFPIKRYTVPEWMRDI